MDKQLHDTVNLGIIRYANCWEDADVLLKGLQPEVGDKILSIGSAGDNSFSLLMNAPSIVVAADISLPQLHLIELKRAVIAQLNLEGALAFLGFKPSVERASVFRKLSAIMPTEAVAYWEHNLDSITKGVVHTGKFEKYFQLFVKRILPLVHSKQKTMALLAEKPLSEQQHFYEKKWNTWRWRMLFKLFFSKWVMGKYGRDKAFLAQVEVPVGQFIFDKAATVLRSENAFGNYMLHYALTADFGAVLPHYLREENYYKIKANLDKLQIFHGYAEDAIAKYGKFNCMNLSNIFEYMDDQHFAKVAKQLTNGAASGSRIAYWNLMVSRSIARISTGAVHQDKLLSESLSGVDKGFFYKGFHLDTLVK